ncbi:protein canopy 4-like [Watersipora subatra]|uniref:protein canopy 4-like n=1 Tax=Watersipora subatra TaxID=2589382 RepID=UPI00355BD1C3
MWRMVCFLFTLVLFSSLPLTQGDVASPYRLPTRCEVCKIFVQELTDRLAALDRNKEVLRLGQGLDDSQKKVVSYQKSELKLIEAIHEPHICDEVKKYNVHAERAGSLRYAKGMSETMSTLHGLKNKGVKVDLGIPEELWDAPNAEVGQMTRECYTMVELHEEDIEDWYWSDQSAPLLDSLCRISVLKGKDLECLDEKWTGVERLDNSPPDDTDEKGDTSKIGQSTRAKGEL